VSQAEGAPTLEQQQQTRVSQLEGEIAQHPLVRAVLDAFPGATIAAVRERFVASGPASEDAAGDDALDDTLENGPADSEEDEP